MARSIEIKKEGGQWKVIRKPSVKYLRGDELEWKLQSDPDDKKKDISAHFQFAHADLVEDLDGESRLSKDLTAVIPAARGTLTLRVKELACRRKNPRYYAVWIADATLPNRGVFAVGESGNPPPDMDIGGP